MAVISKGTTFATGDQVTASKLNNLADNAAFTSGAVDNVSTQLSGGGIIVKDGGVSTAKLADDSVTPAKVSFVDDSLASTDGHILVADGSEYNNVPVSGDVTIDNTGAVTIADDAVESSMIADDVALGGNPTTTTQASGDDSTRIATTAFVQGAVKTLDSGFTELGTSSASGTASKDGFIIATANSGFNNPYSIGITVAGILFQCRDFDTQSGNRGTVTIPIANGETYSVSASGNTKKIYFKGLS